ncbi:MAG: geranylgeranylglycerol-phosphate geranylgeranyltransferase [Candidatus Poribacteria bacterium]
MRKILYFIELSRPINGLIAFISVFLGALLASGSLSPLANVFIVAIAAFLIISAGNALNDFCDVKIDKINKPQRPIPSGKITRKEALTYSVILLEIGTGMGIIINLTAFLIALSVSVCLAFYAIWLKRTPLAGNIVVGLLTALIFVSGGVAVNSLSGTIIPAIFAFLFTTAREIVKDIEDIEGDRKAGAKTIPIFWGRRVAMYLIFIFMASVIVFSPIPYLARVYSWKYLIAVVLGVDCVLCYCMASLWRSLSRENVKRIQKLMKLDIFIGLGAMFLG